MPNRVYLALHEPPRLGDRIGAHIVELILLVFSVRIGLLLLINSFVPGWTASSSAENLPTILTAWVGSLAVIGGLLAGWGILWPARFVDNQWIIEKVGWAFFVTAFIVYGVATLGVRPASVISWDAAFTLAAAGLGRLIVVDVIERRTRRRVAGMVHQE